MLSEMKPKKTFVKVPAQPEAVQVDLARAAVVVVDMQNAFASKGGMFDTFGVEVSKNRGVIKPIREVYPLLKLQA